MRSPRGWTWVVAAGAVWGAACGGRDEKPGIPDPQAVQQRAALLPFGGPRACEDLEQYIEDTAVLQMRTELELAKSGVGVYRVDVGGMPGSAEGDAAATSAAPQAAPSAYTTTNTQVQGVDEADFVKNDGTRIFVLSGNTLYANRSWPAASLANVGKLAIEGWPQEMFLHGDNRVVVFSSIYERYPLSVAFDTGATSALYAGYSYGNTTKVTVVDVSDLAQPKVTRELYLPGHYANARKVGGSVRLVLSDEFRYPAAVRFWPDYEEGLYEDEARKARAFDALIASNERLIRQQTLAEWLPAGRLVENGVRTPLPYDCAQFHRNNGPTQLGLLTVATLNLDAPSAVHRATVVARVGEVYASQKSLYVANTHWWWWPLEGQTDATYLHKFDISQPDAAVYVASGKVDGQLVDQFSLDENAQGYLRVASTLSTRVADPQSSWGRLETTNRLFVFAEVNGALEVVGQSEELAKGERIYSARFVGDRGYVVTFRQVDPLYTFDLKDPTQPKKVGELKVPGFSTYLHPVDENHLLAIGTYVPEDGNDWRARTLQLTLFDVTDPAAPKQKFVQQVGTAYSWSEAQYEHKAFNYFPERKLLAIPFFDWSQVGSGVSYWEQFVSELRVFEVDVQTGFTAKGAVSMKDLYRTANSNGWDYYWSPMVRRSVMADEFVYAISDAGIRVADIADLSTPVATVQFDRAQP